MRYSPSCRNPEPASKMMTCSRYSTLTHDVFPPNVIVWSPGDGIDPRTPQNVNVPAASITPLLINGAWTVALTVPQCRGNHRAALPGTTPSMREARWHARV